MRSWCWSGFRLTGTHEQGTYGRKLRIIIKTVRGMHSFILLFTRSMNRR